MIISGESKKYTCINHTALLFAFDIALYTADPRDQIYDGSSVGGVFSLKVSLCKHATIRF